MYRRRLLILTCCFLATAFAGQRAMRPETLRLRQSLEQLPRQIERWTGRDAQPMSDDVVAKLGVDDYTSRIYLARNEPPVALYVGYYGSQRQGDSIHSPLNCLPGAGWQVASRGRLDLGVPGRSLPAGINRFVIQKGLDRQVVLYWYQSHGRVVASEYTSKALLVWDALRSNRSDAALVRVISPIMGNESSDEAAARRATEFAQALFPNLERFLPS